MEDHGCSPPAVAPLLCLSVSLSLASHLQHADELSRALVDQPIRHPPVTEKSKVAVVGHLRGGRVKRRAEGEMLGVLSFIPLSLGDLKGYGVPYIFRMLQQQHDNDDDVLLYGNSAEQRQKGTARDRRRRERQSDQLTLRIFPGVHSVLMSLTGFLK